MNTKLCSLSLVLAVGLLFANTEHATAQLLPPGHVDDFAGKPRVVVLSDMALRYQTRNSLL